MVQLGYESEGSVIKDLDIVALKKLEVHAQKMPHTAFRKSGYGWSSLFGVCVCVKAEIRNEQRNHAQHRVSETRVRENEMWIGR